MIGQINFSNAARNDSDQDGIGDSVVTPSVLYTPDGLLFYRDRLLVLDYGNNRVLIFRSN